MCKNNIINRRELSEWERVFCQPWKCRVFDKVGLTIKVIMIAVIVIITFGLALLSFALYALVQACAGEGKPIEVEQRPSTPVYPSTPTPTSSPKEVILEVEEKNECLTPITSQREELSLVEEVVEEVEVVTQPVKKIVTQEMIEARKLSAVTFFMMHIFDEDETFADGVEDLQNASFEQLSLYFDKRKIAGSRRGFKLKFEGDDVVKKLPEFMYAPFFIVHIEFINCPNIHVDLSRLPSLRTVKIINCPEVVIDSQSVAALLSLETFYVSFHPVKEIDFSPCKALEKICLLDTIKLRRLKVSGCKELNWCVITNAKELKELPIGLDRSLKKLSLVGFSGCDHLRFKSEDLGRIHPAVKTFYRNGHFYIENFDMQSDPRFNQLDAEGLSQEVLEP